MLKNYFKIAIRNLLKYKTNSAINIFGLTLGMLGCLLIGLFVWDEFQYDRSHPDGEFIYRIYNERTDNQGSSLLAIVPPTFGPTMQKDFPEVESSLRMLDTYGKKLFKFEDHNFMESNGFFAESSIFDFFDLEVLKGDPVKALEEPNSLVLTQKLAEKYFGKEDPIGKTINIDGADGQVTAVIKDIPRHFHLDFQYLISFSTVKKLVSPDRLESWVWQQFLTYIKLKPGTQAAQLAQKFPDFVNTYAIEKTKPSGFTYLPKLQNVKDIYLRSSSFLWDPARKGNINYIFGLSIIGLFLLIIACINFINLATARADRRTLEVAVRKVSGATRWQLVNQFSGETVLLTLIASVLALQMARILLPYLNNFTGKQLSLSLVNDSAVFIIVLAGAIFIGLFAGIYPSLVLARFKPVKILKGYHGSENSSGKQIRKGLVLLQFTLSALLIIATIVIAQQVNYLTNKDYGFNKDQLLLFRLRGKMSNNFENTKAEFLKIPQVTGATTGYGFPGDIIAGDNINKPGEANSYPANLFTIDHDYIKTMGMEIIAGRDFEKKRSTDATEAFILNETAVKELGFASAEKAIDQKLEWPEWNENSDLKKGKVIGVVRDFHFKPLHEKIETAVLHIYPSAFWQMCLRVNTQNFSETMESIKKTWDTFETGYPIEFVFVDESFGAKYTAEQKLSTLLFIFCTVTILVACMGLFGLISFIAEQKTKEIGIRKVLGASVRSVVFLISKEFIFLVIVALFIASPLAWYFLRGWLENFAYHINIEWWVFVLAGMITLIIAIFTVSIQSIQAALRNPINALRDY